MGFRIVKLPDIGEGVAEAEYHEKQAATEASEVAYWQTRDIQTTATI